MKKLTRIIFAFSICVKLVLALPAVQAFDLPATQVSILDVSGLALPEATTNADWRPYDASIPAAAEDYWIRVTIELIPDTDEPAAETALALSIRVNGAYRLYWDGQILGSTMPAGKHAPFATTVTVPPALLTPGTHEILMHMNSSAMQMGDGIGLQLIPDGYGSLWRMSIFRVSSVITIASLALLAAVYLSTLLLSTQEKGALYLAIILSICITGIILTDQGSWIFNISYSRQKALDTATAVFAISLLLALPAYYYHRLRLQHRIIWCILIAVSMVLSMIPFIDTDHDVRAFIIILLLLISMSIVAIRQKNKDGRLLLSAAFLALCALLIDPDIKHLFLFVLVCLLCLELARDIRTREKQSLERAVTGEKLRSSLIKRNIQPHFMMNSLTALMEWVETDTDTAVAFIDGLGAEMRCLNDFTERDYVLLDEEIDLCRSHLHLMSLRLGGEYILEESGVPLDRTIPPAIFHTLIENAFSHNDYRGCSLVFSLTVQSCDGYDILCLSVPVCREKNSPVSQGTGTEYIVSRLEEQYGSHYQMHSRQEGHVWKTTIRLPVMTRP